MFKHFKNMEFTVRVDRPDPNFAVKLLEQFGGGNGELKAAMQYLIQSFGCNDPRIRDLMQDVAAEEFSHFEMVGECIAMLLGNVDKVPKDFAAPYMAILGGGPTLTDSAGNPWTGAFVNATGDLITDLQSNLAAELRAKLVYERLLQQTDDPGVKDMIRFLLSREEAHAASWSEAIAANPNKGVMKDFGDSTFSHMYMDLSQGPGNAFGPWNQNNFQVLTNPQEKFGSLPQYNHDAPAQTPNEFGTEYHDNQRNNPNYPHPQHHQ
ncbi:MAG: manganese catalase family protein [Clostridia bacterium]|jgi:Mn-containing catalase|nr:manganese catalase family protein [Clostridia bacterium]